MSLIAAVLIFGVIILIHEFGHFLFAKLGGIGVVEFSLGMGPRLWSREFRGTRYSIKALPFGGSCMMLGEDEDNADQAAFNNKSVWTRISVIAAGPAFNFLLAFLLSLIMVAATGYTTSQVVEVSEGYPAQEAGIQAGDVITRIDGRRIHTYKDVNLYMLTHPGRSFRVTWQREENGEKVSYTAQIEPEYSQEYGYYMMGVTFSGVPLKVSNPLELAVRALYDVEYWIRYVFDSLYMMFQGAVGLDDLSGPVGIVSAIDSTVDEAASYGPEIVALTLLNFCILLSANLGVMNLLPIPALDGGRLVFLIIEAVRGKPVDKEKEGMVHLAGMLFLLALMMFVLFNDVKKLL